MFSPDELREIAARASTIDERLAGRYQALHTAESAAKANRCVTRWRRIVADGNSKLFERRLSRDSLDITSLTPLLGHVRLDPQAEPLWLKTFEWAVMAMTSSGQSLQPAGFHDPGNPLPFEDLFAPLAAACSRRISTLTGSSAKLVSRDAELDLERSLARRFSELFTPTLFERFALFRLLQQPLASVLALPAGDPGSRVVYKSYLAALQAGTLRECFLDRPVLARLLATIVDQWTLAGAELMVRLQADFNSISNTFYSGRDPGPVTHIACGLSDPHNGGRTVCTLTFARGLKVVYKPRDLGIDAAWHNLLFWLGARTAPVSIRAPAVLPRNGYGWAEFIEQAPCADEDDARRFFLRCGGILCLVSVLAGTDLNFENMIASGGNPVLIDLETLMHPSVSNPSSAEGPRQAFIAAAELLRDSVLAPGFLPNWMIVPGARLAGIGALNPPDARKFKQWKVLHANTDAMTWELVTEAVGPRDHLPLLGGNQLFSVDYPGEIADGFETTYRFLMQHTPALLDPAGPLAAFREKAIRVILRPTQLYSLILEKSLQGKNLSDGVEWSLQFELLSRFAAWDEEKDPNWEVLRAERNSLVNLDVPYFTARTGSSRLESSGLKQIGEGIEKTGFERCISKLMSLSGEDLRRQLAFIRQALESARKDPGSLLTETWQDRTRATKCALEQGSALRVAREFARLLEREAIRAGGGAAWIGAVAMPREENSQLRVIGFDLYSGAAGVALFLAAVEHLTGGDGLRDLASAALAPLRAELRGDASGPRLARVLGIGGAVGLGSVVYGLTQSAVLLDSEDLLRDAQTAAALITPERIAEDRFLDVIAGAAGAILGLLALYRVSGVESIMQTAISCGHHLLSKQDVSSKAWRTIEETPLTGFSHGAAGIALALLKLYAATGDRAFLTAALNGIEFERTAFSPELGNWPDFRPLMPGSSEPDQPCQWCHGAAGIGLARLGGLDVMDNPEVRAEIEVALRTTEAYEFGVTDHLCCGNFGRLETLFLAGLSLRRSELIDLALDRANQVVVRREQGSGYRWAAGTDAHNPGFFTGVSGVGYELLRLCYPDILPSILLWEPPVSTTKILTTASGSAGAA